MLFSPMNCPFCQKNMKEVKTSAHYGIPIAIDQCESCGGLWFDESELYRTQIGAAREIEKEIDVEKLRKFTDFKSDDFFCPRDGEKLKLFKDWSFPQSIKVEICPKCSGFWFNHGEFSQFQDLRQKKISEFKEKELITKQSEEFDKKLNEKIVNLMKLYGQMEMENQRKENKDKVETIFYVIWMLLKIFFSKGK